MYQWRVLTKDLKVDDIEPRHQHIQDLINLLQTDQMKDSLPIVIGDFNEDFSDEKKMASNSLQHRVT